MFTAGLLIGLGVNIIFHLMIVILTNINIPVAIDLARPTAFCVVSVLALVILKIHLKL